MNIAYNAIYRQGHDEGFNAALEAVSEALAKMDWTDHGGAGCHSYVNTDLVMNPKPPSWASVLTTIDELQKPIPQQAVAA